MDYDVDHPVDYWGKDARPLKEKRLFLLDMDGTIYKDDLLFDGTLQLLNYIENIKGKYIFITNNSSKSVTEYIAKLKRLGIKTDKNNFFTSTQATVLFLKNNFPGQKIYCQGTFSMIEELKNAGIDLTTKCNDDVKVVLVGFDTELSFEKLNETCKILSTKEVEFIATNPDLRCPVAYGFVPDCGSIVQMIENATGKRPVFIGKPQPTMITTAMEKFGANINETVVIGDRLYTDIASGINAGIDTVCVLSGETTIKDIKSSDIIPTYTFHSVLDFWRTLEDE